MERLERGRKYQRAENTKLYIWNYQVNLVCSLTEILKEWSIPDEDQGASFGSS